MKKRHLMSLKDILESMNRIDSYTKDMGYDSFSQNQLVIDAVIRNLEIIGEAAKNIPEEVKNKYNKIPWRKMIGLRNVLIHEYFGVDELIVWEIIKTDLLKIKPDILRAIKEEEGLDIT
ncbi:MAG: DUF86 domain-containing protein [Firmicutes bacterium]|nr:DUF86 domain-containing protein [Bacillota bacterium]